MKKADIRVVTGTEGEVIDWLNGVNTLPELPALADVTCLWFTLNNEASPVYEKLHANGVQTVVILHQDGWFTPPENIEPALSRYILQARCLEQPLWLVLSGGDLAGSKQAWEEKQAFVTHGRPPLFRLQALVLATSLVYGEQARKVLRPLLRLVRRRK
ncbi:hypothetical protein ACG1VR_13790 [Cedecea davisae]|uniref:hypothetical protein n=1 Tax=Cedecea davisae TaxID=158484 RepID=UPI00376EAF24